MSFAHWLALVVLIQQAFSTPLSSPSNTLSLEKDPVYELSPNTNNVVVVPKGTLDSRFIIGGWKPIFSDLLSPEERQNDSLERPTKRAYHPIAVHCHADRYGSPDYLSCGQAMVTIPNQRRKVAFTPRTGHGDWDYGLPQPLPFRWVSSNGRCVIEIANENPSGTDHASGADIRNAVRKVTSECLMNLNQGGVATGLGDNGQLILQIKADRPQVECATPPSEHDLRLAGYCQIVLNGMPASTRPVTVGRGPLHPWVALPMTFTDAEEHCRITIDIRGSPIVTRSYDFWGAASSILAKCINYGRDGTAIVNSRLAKQTDSNIIIKMEAGPGPYDSDDASA